MRVLSLLTSIVINVKPVMLFRRKSEKDDRNVGGFTSHKAGAMVLN
jgi:hypothetical protein